MNPLVVFAGLVAIFVAALLVAEALVWALAARTMDRIDAAETKRRADMVRALQGGEISPLSFRFSVSEDERGLSYERPMRWNDGGAS